MIEKIRKQKKILIRIGLGVLALVLIMALTSRYLAYKFKPLVKAQIKELVLRSTDSLYHIEFSDIRMNLLTANASLTGVKVIPDLRIFKKLIALKKAPNNIYHLELEKLEIRNFHLYTFLRHRKLHISQLRLDRPDVVMVNQQFDFNEDKLSRPNASPFDYISEYLKELAIHTIDLNNISFKYINNNGEKPREDAVKNLNITLKDYLIDPHSSADKSRLYLLKDVVIKLNNYTYATPDSLYHIRLDQLDFSAASGKLNIQSLGVVPRYNEMEFGKSLGYSKDRYAIQMSDLSLEGINLPLYILKQELLAKEMTVANGSVRVFNNKALPKLITEKIGRYPHQLLQRVEGKLTIEKLNVSNVDISYSEYDEDSQQKGTITFENTSGSLSNVTNVPKYKAKNPWMTADLKTYLMGRGRLDVGFKFNLEAKDGAFSYSGLLGSMDGRSLNRITRPLGMIAIKSGDVKRMEFQISANDRVANGIMKFEYNNLSVNLLKREEGENRLVRQGWMSFLANAIILNPNNPSKDGMLVTAKIHEERAKNGSFFHFVWKSLLQGIKHSVGITEAKEQKIKTQIATFEQIKIDREARQARREKRRLQRERAKRHKN
ncbi:hypothetical protein QG516_16285 [Pedobacter gandavensis]|uniref:hypothetical protein n=1 Tax=Pedobacter gandavensis TaxID=2679963 RepID=UPI0024788E17|nr:hypothetical protein [Pedobacter gandavensis]WGQ08101.1 hypothetical protein QG516_16285 [Pedobacter gandavensis]